MTPRPARSADAGQPNCFYLHKRSAPTGTRTQTVRILSPVPLCVGWLKLCWLRRTAAQLAQLEAPSRDRRNRLRTDLRTTGLHRQIALVRAGVVFHKGKLLERPTDITPGHPRPRPQPPDRSRLRLTDPRVFEECTRAQRTGKGTRLRHWCSLVRTHANPDEVPQIIDRLAQREELVEFSLIPRRKDFNFGCGP